MTDQVIASLDQVTVDWLTDVLTRSGALASGRVEGFEVDATNEFRLSKNARLRVRYAAGSSGDRPRNLFLKLVETDQDDEFFGPSEVNYYVRDYVGVESVPIPRAYDAQYSEKQGRYHILMDDLSATHIESFAKTPTLEHGLALAEGLAAMHAHYWGRERLEAANEPIPDADAIRRYVEIAQPGAAHIIDACADQLGQQWIDLIGEVYEAHPQKLIERTQDGSGFTLVHGDVNGKNILVPIDADRPLYVIDRQPFDWSLTTWLGANDLAYAMVVFWETDLRRRFELPVLRRYHETLMSLGVKGYAWEQLYDDYRLSVVMGVYVATEWCREQFEPETMPIWMDFLQRSLTAIDDLECYTLWR